MNTQSNYVRFPTIDVFGKEYIYKKDASNIGEYMKNLATEGKKIFTVECYPGVNQEEIVNIFSALNPSLIIHSDELAFEPEKIDEILEKDLMPSDPVFGIMTVRELKDYFYGERIEEAKKAANEATGTVLIYGVGASLVHTSDVQIVADITRWEIQLRYRRGMSNWRTSQTDLPKLKKYKRGFFAEWRWADKVKDNLLNTMDFYFDMTSEGNPAMIDGNSYRAALLQASKQPFRLVPYFDPGVWGGNWMKEKFNLPENGSNYAWSFDGVPEENSLILNFDGNKIETPALNLVYQQPRLLLGEHVHARFGKEFPIRFDMLDTINGQNLSLQVHPLTEYIQRNFNMHYTQDESYYILDAQEDSSVWLGVKTGVDREAMARDLRDAQAGKISFPAEKYVNHVPVKKHDHVLIPAGTVHCSGAGTMVLEISATPYIFTFKMWDWDRVDLDGKPRPIHVERGLENIQWERNTEWIEREILHQDTIVYQDEHTLIERTGLHEREFIDTFRISTDSKAEIKRNGSVHVLNLVEGREARIVSPTNEFNPFTVHYAETFILPEGAGEYCIEADEPVKVIMANVRK